MAIGSIVLWFRYGFLSFRKLSIVYLTVSKITPTVVIFSGKVDKSLHVTNFFYFALLCPTILKLKNQ